MKNKIKFGIIGCSSIAERSTIPAINESQNAELKILGSRSYSKAKKFAKKFSCQSFGNYDDVLENKEIDAVYISLPISLQKDWIEKSAKAGKHIICEKSAVISFRDAKKVVNICRKNQVRLIEGFMFRFHPQHQKIIELIQKNILGQINSFYSAFGFVLKPSPNEFRLKRNLGGGSLNDVGCYPICGSRLIFQNEPIWVSCDLLTNNKFKVDIMGSMIVKYPKKRISLLEFGYQNIFQSMYKIWGSKGIAQVERAYNVPKTIKTSIKLQIGDATKKMTVKPINQFKLLITDFCNTIISKHSSYFNYEIDLLNQAKVMESARQSNLKKKRIYLDKIR